MRADPKSFVSTAESAFKRDFATVKRTANENTEISLTRKNLLKAKEKVLQALKKSEALNAVKLDD